jgi:hypothetical protein
MEPFSVGGGNLFGSHSSTSSSSSSEDQLEEVLRLLDTTNDVQIDPIILAAGENTQKASELHEAVHQRDHVDTSDH